jgi:hypothetical protein
LWGETGRILPDAAGRVNSTGAARFGVDPPARFENDRLTRPDSLAGAA